MPTYEYECAGCGHHFEEFQGITEDKLKTCPECKKDTLERLIGAGAAVLFKGSGFYQTDYRSQEYTEKAKADSTSESAASSGTESGSTSESESSSKSESKSKGDAKPDAKASSSESKSKSSSSKPASKSKKSE